MILILPPKDLLIIVAKNSSATAPTISSVNDKVEKELEIAYSCNFSKPDILCRIKRTLSSIGENHLEDIIYRLAGCENGFKETGCGDNGASCGFLQFQQPTWNEFDCDGSRLNLEDSVVCATKLINAGIGHTYGGWKRCWEIEKLPIIKTSP